MINIYIPQNYRLIQIDFIIFSLAFLLLIDKIICYVFRSSNILTKLFKYSDIYNDEFSLNTILFLLMISVLPKAVEYLLS